VVEPLHRSSIGGEKDHLECTGAASTSLAGWSLFEDTCIYTTNTAAIPHRGYGSLQALFSPEDSYCDSACSEEGATLLSVSPQSRAPSRSRSEQRV